jgi:hypothetical protein
MRSRVAHVVYIANSSRTTEQIRRLHNPPTYLMKAVCTLNQRRHVGLTHLSHRLHRCGALLVRFPQMRVTHNYTCS